MNSDYWKQKRAPGRLTVILLHLLKWRRQPEKRRASGEASISLQRNRLADHLDDNPSRSPESCVLCA